MNTKIECQVCEGTNVVDQEYETDLLFKGVDLHVAALSQSHCLDCGYLFETHAQHDENLSKIRAKFLAERADFKRERNLLTGSDILNIRQSFGLTQRAAAGLFGGGANAFSKYENEEVVQTTSMDKLLRLVFSLGSVALDRLKELEVFAPGDHFKKADIQCATGNAVTVVVLGNYFHRNSATAIFEASGVAEIVGTSKTPYRIVRGKSDVTQHVREDVNVAIDAYFKDQNTGALSRTMISSENPGVVH